MLAIASKVGQEPLWTYSLIEDQTFIFTPISVVSAKAGRDRPRVLMVGDVCEGRPGRCSRKGDLNLGVKTDQSTMSKRWRGENSAYHFQGPKRTWRI